MREISPANFVGALSYFCNIPSLIRGVVGAVFRGKLTPIRNITAGHNAADESCTSGRHSGHLPPSIFEPCQFSAENWPRCNTEFSVSQGWL